MSKKQLYALLFIVVIPLLWGLAIAVLYGLGLEWPLGGTASN